MTESPKQAISLLNLMGQAGGLDLVREKIGNRPIIAGSLKEAKDYICRYPLAEFLGIGRPRSHRCLFHPDRHPSASIHNASDTGHELYTCNGRCRTTWDIIGLVQEKHHVPYITALKMLAYVMNIQIPEDGTVANSYDQKLRENMALITKLSDYPTIYRELTQAKARFSPLDILQHLTEYAVELYQSKQILRDTLGRPVFYISIRELLRQLSSGDDSAVASGKYSAKITLLAYLGFLERVPDDELSPAALGKAKSPEFDYRKRDPERYANSRGNRISFYRLPILTPDLLQDIETHQARRWDRWYSINSVSYKKICSTEGKRIADTIYGKRYVRSKSDNDPLK